MIRARYFLMAVWGLFLFAPMATAGSKRYDLPELLGAHEFDGTPDDYLGPIAYVDTPYRYFEVRHAKVVLVGKAVAGKGHGDGILRQNVDFDLLPYVIAVPSFTHSFVFPAQSTVGPIGQSEEYLDPFSPEVYPLPGPDDYPPVSFNVRLSINPSFENVFPPLIEPLGPGEFVIWNEGLIIDQPIVATITEAYVLLDGPGVVPEPASAALAAIAFLLIGGRIRTTGFARASQVL